MAEPEAIQQEQSDLVGLLQREAENRGWTTEVTGIGDNGTPNVLDLTGPSGQGYTLSVGPHL